MWFGLFRVVQFHVSKDNKSGIHSILIGLVEGVLKGFDILIGEKIVSALDGRTQAHELAEHGHSTEDRQRNVNVVFGVVFAVVIVSEVVEKLAGVGKDEGRQLLRVFDPFFDEAFAAVELGMSDDDCHQKEQGN